MARIPNDELDRLKSEVSVQRLAEAAGITLKRHGADLLGLCPFHDDHEPSLVISPKNNLWHCLGACQSGGSVIDWVMKREGVSFRHAVELLRSDLPLLAAKNKKSVAQSRTKKLDNPFDRDADDQALLNQVIDYYHEALQQSPEVLAYLDKRGLYDPALIERFKLGFANRTLGYRLPEKSRKAGAEIRGRLQTLGLYRPSGHEHFRGSLVIPVIDGEGNVTEVYGRKITPNLRAGTPLHLYLPGAHVGVWNAAGLIDQTEVILCEALIDALTFWAAGYHNVTASYGVEGFTTDHLAVLKAHGIERVLIAYDRDSAGNSAAEKLAKQLQREGLACYRLNFPKGMDANAYALNVQPASHSLGVVIRSAEWLGDGEAPECEPANEIQDVPDSPPTLAADVPAKPETPQAPALPAAAVPPKPDNLEAPTVTDHELTIAYGDRHYRVRGLAKNTSYEVLKVNVLVKVNDALHVDTFDLYSAKHRQAFARVAAGECGIEDKIIQRDLGQLLLHCEALQDAAIQAVLKPGEPTGYTMDETEREQALALLKDKGLAERIVSDFTQTGLVGEPANALMGYLATVSRKLTSPLAIVVQSTSAAGKSALMDAVLKLVPPEDRVQYSAMTGQSLFYLGESDLKHKCLAIAEEEGVRQAAYALKLLQSEGELTIASTGKDPETGKLITEEYRVEGPVMLFLTTTAIDIDEELLNRCVVLTINESRAQTAAIQQRQRQARTLSGLLASRESDQIIQQHQNAQRLLRPLAVVNPYAEQLAFADSRTRTRRDHEKYLTLIDSIALLHQYQRETKRIEQYGQVIEYIEVTLDDIALANDLAHQILGHSLDELPPPTRGLLHSLHRLVAEQQQAEGLRQQEVRFTRRDVREAAGLSDKQVRVHLERLVELEYVFAHYGKNGQRFVYELVFDGELDAAAPQLPGLIDVEQLKTVDTTSNLVASKADPVASSGPGRGPLVATPCTPENTQASNTGKALPASDHAAVQTAHPGQKNKSESYRNPHPSLAAAAPEG